MADKHPYVSANGSLIQVLDHLRKSFPSTVDADVLRKLGFAPHNESYVINTLRFLKVIDESGGRTDQAQKTFTLHDSATFNQAFSTMIKAAYDDLFKLHSDNAWDLETSKLITYFRQADQSSELVGTRQAGTFRTLAVYAGRSQAPANGTPGKSKSAGTGKPKTKASVKTSAPQSEPEKLAAGGGNGNGGNSQRDLGLTVRIEINLPASGDQETYDKIFKSIRQNLLNG